MNSLVKKFVADESGATAIEYGLIVGLISVVIIAAATSIGNELKTDFDAINKALQDATPAGSTSSSSGG